jgi:PAS domain S-box-containing protein
MEPVNERTPIALPPYLGRDANRKENGHRPSADRVRESFGTAQAQWMRYQELFEFAADGCLMTDLRGVIYEANHAAATLLNSHKEFLIGKPLGLFLADEDHQPFYARLARLAKSEAIDQWEATIRRSRNGPRDVSLTVAVLADEDGRPSKLRWMLRDISLIREAERALRAEKNLADCLVETAEVFILIVDARGRIIRSNPFLLDVSGYLAHELHGRDWREAFLPAEDRPAGRLLMEEALLDGSSKSGILGFAAKGGCHFVAWSARSVGQGLVLIGHDVTELQEAQRQALQAERLAAIGQVAATLAHESRNALQRGQACLSLLGLRLHGQPEARDLLARAQKAHDDLQRLFDDVRTYAVVPPLRPQACDVRRTWREAWTELGDVNLMKAELHEDTDGMDLSCWADPFYLRQVFRNLLENALASGACPVRVAIRCRPISLDGRAALRVSVRDNGPGFPKEHRHRLFEPFFTTKSKGTGLGLAICKRIVEAHGGRIEAGAEPAPGAEIVLLLPRRET